MAMSSARLSFCVKLVKYVLGEMMVSNKEQRECCCVDVYIDGVESLPMRGDSSPVKQ